MNERTERKKNQKRWSRVRRVLLDSQRRGWFRANRVNFALIENDPSALDHERLLIYLGIHVGEKKTWGWACQCFCGSTAATFNPVNRRYRCPKAGGCSLGQVDLVRLVYLWVERGYSRPSSKAS